MTTRTTPFAPGTPCWVDLVTSDPERSAAFSSALLGWEFRDLGEELGGYTLATSGGEPVAGLMRNTDASHSPDAWSSYLATDAIEVTVATATDAGATVLAPPLPQGPLGTLAGLVDPAGAVVGLWPGRDHLGFTRHGEPGSVLWDAVHSKSVGASRDFYATASGRRYEVTGDSDDFGYLTVKVDGSEVAGLMDPARFLPDQVPSHWAVYLGVADADAAERVAAEHGPTVLMSAQDTPFGRIADLLDPTGAPCKLHPGTLKNPPPAE